MFSILEFDETTPEQVEKAVKDGLIHPIAAKKWLAARLKELGVLEKQS